MAEFPEGEALALAKNSGLLEESLPRFAQLYREICSGWDGYEYDDDEDLVRFAEQNRIKTDFCIFLEKYTQYIQMGHGDEFSYEYAYNLYLGEAEEDAKTMAYRASGSLSGNEAAIDCRAAGRSPAFTQKYIECISNREREDDAVRWAKEYEKGVLECAGRNFSEIYIREYADRRINDGDPEYAHPFAYCYERRIEAGASDIDAGAYAGKFAEFLALTGTSSFHWIRAVVCTEASLRAREKKLDAKTYEQAFDAVFFRNNPMDCAEEFKKTAVEIMSGRLDLTLLEQSADELYAAMEKQRLLMKQKI